MPSSELKDFKLCKATSPNRVLEVTPEEAEKDLIEYLGQLEGIKAVIEG